MLKMVLSRAIVLFCALGISPGFAESARDVPFQQAVSVKFPLPAELRGTVRKLAIDQDGIVYILSTRGMARLFEDRIALDQSYRPLAGKIPLDITVANGKLYYLYSDELVCNRDAGKLVIKLPASYEHLSASREDTILLWGTNGVARVANGAFSRIQPVPAFRPDLVAEGVAANQNSVVVDYPAGSPLEVALPGLSSISRDANGIVFGTARGLIHGQLSAKKADLESRLPATNITALDWDGHSLWAGTDRGVWRKDAQGAFRYFASRRWLDQDKVIDIKADQAGNAYALTATGLNKIEFRKMTLAEKAAWYDRKIRQRHIRYGFCAELRLKTPGDITTEEMIDTDNDGTWSNYYMASQAFRFAATGDTKARSNAWETFTALERLESINPLHGFPSRTFERAGFKVSDPERWHPVGDGIWEWKAHTSSDEITAHMFGSAVLYETTARSAAEKERIAAFVSKVLDHILSHNLYLVDTDGKPTLWARWNPEYVNAFPHTIYDRRLNSAEIIAALQFGYKITGKEAYKKKALELLYQEGYLENIVSPMSRIKDTPGFKHQGIEMGNEWNHSDDLLGFVTYWTLCRFPFNEELAASYRAAVRDHWEIERAERSPLWNFVYASSGATDCGLEDALWTLRGFPLDMIDWSVDNSHRADITRLPENFRHRQLVELLPPDERRITRWNSQPFILNGGNGGSTELAGDEFLLPYWMGRYLKLIEE